MGIQTQTTDTPPHIAIIGAGLTGLLVAQALKKNGFPNTTVYERQPAIDSRPRDWTIVIHWAMPTFLDLLPEHIRDNISKGFCNPHLDFSDESTESIVCYDGQSGKQLFTNKMPGSRRVSRQKLRGILSEGLDIRWGKELVAIETNDDDGSGTVKLVFTDGDVVEADYVLGTDGPGSTVRRLLFPDREEDSALVNSGFMIATGVVKYGDAEMVEKIVEAHPVAAMTMSADTVMGFGVMNADDPEDKSTWSTFWVKIWRGTIVALPVPRQGPEALEYIMRSTTGLAQRFQAFVEQTPGDSSCYIDEMKYWVPIPFNNRKGRVTLAGDAAHPMLPYRGQGYQHAVSDARNYVDALVKVWYGGEEREAVMTAYDVEMIERGAEAVKQAAREAELSMSPETVSKMLMVKKGHGRLTQKV